MTMDFPDITPIFWLAFVMFFVIVCGTIGWGFSFIGPWWVTPAGAVIGFIVGHLLFKTVK
jgi:hypothetical protein